VKDSSEQGRERFPKVERIRKSREFEAVFENGRVVRDDQLRVYNAPNGLDLSRLGLVVSKKVGDSVRRNRVKRLFREAFRLNKDRLPGGFDLVVAPLPGFADDSLQEVQDRFLRLLDRLPRGRK
jgi:ribonuclease P protein component